MLMPEFRNRAPGMATRVPWRACVHQALKHRLCAAHNALSMRFMYVRMCRSARKREETAAMTLVLSGHYAATYAAVCGESICECGRKLLACGDQRPASAGRESESERERRQNDADGEGGREAGNDEEKKRSVRRKEEREREE